MPRREVRTYSSQARRVTPASDVTVWTKIRANTGTSAAAGMVTGAWLGRPGDSNAVEGESGLSRSGPGWTGEQTARQWFARLRATGGAGRIGSDERADGLLVRIRLEDVPVADFGPPPALGKVEVTEAALAGSLRHKWLLRLLWCAVCVPREVLKLRNSYGLAAANCGIQCGRRQFKASGR